MATDFEALIPVGVASELIAAAERESVAMRLGNVQRMPEGIESVSVVSVEPDAEWNALGARKKATTIEWSALRLESEELACILAIPQAWIDDTAEHRLRGTRGIWDLDIIVTFGGDVRRQLRRRVVSWDWGPSKFGRCPTILRNTGSEGRCELLGRPEALRPGCGATRVAGDKIGQASRPSQDTGSRPRAGDPHSAVPRRGCLGWRCCAATEAKDDRHQRPHGVVPP